MWAVRRTLNPLRSYGHHVGSARACYAKLHTPTNDSEHVCETCHAHQVVSSRCVAWPKSSNQSPSSLAKFSLGSRGLSSEASRDSDEEDKLEDGFSEIDSPCSDISEEKTLKEDSEDSDSEMELLDDEAEDSLAGASLKEHDLSDAEEAAMTSTKDKPTTCSEILNIIMNSNRSSLINDLNKWYEEGKPLERAEITLVLSNLRKRRMFGAALQFSEWVESKKKLTFEERDYASRLDLIAKMRGLNLAEKYIQNIPESFRGEIVYRTLLANCASANNLRKSQDVFNKMRDLGLKVTVFACNQLLLLYKRIDKKKIADVLLFMEKEDIKPSAFTYRVLIDTKGHAKDMTGMEQLIETMKEQGYEPDIITQVMIASHYISGGLKDKAEVVMKEMEGGNLKENRTACRGLLTLYARLGKADEVERIWKVCDSDLRMEECLSAVKAWGILGKVEKAEEVFERMAQRWKKLSTRNYTALLEVYADHKMLTKGKEIVKRMASSGCHIGPWTWDALVKLFVDAGEVEKASSILQKASQGVQGKPLYRTYLRVMEQYAKRGDVHGAEKLFHMVKQAGYGGRIQQFHTLLDAYIQARSPPYGFKERMQAEEVFPNKILATKLAQADAFKKTVVSDLLD